MLIGHGAVTLGTTPSRHKLERATQSLGHRLLLHDPVALARARPEVSEAQEVGALRALGPRGPLERDELRFLGMEFEAVSSEALRQHLLDPPRVRLMFEDDHEVVRIAD